jgi:hypothetical protein
MHQQNNLLDYTSTIYFRACPLQTYTTTVLVLEISYPKLDS